MEDKQALITDFFPILDEIATLIRENEKLRECIDYITAEDMSQSSSKDAKFEKNSSNIETALGKCLQKQLEEKTKLQ